MLPRSGLRVEQPVQVHDEVAHVRVVDGRLRLALPGGVGGGVIRKHADDVEIGELLELVPLEARELAAEDEMQELLLVFRLGHRDRPAASAAATDSTGMKRP